MLRAGVMAFVTVQLVAAPWSTAAAQSVPSPVTLSASELHEFRTKGGVLYDVYVAFPLSYDADGDAEYPVLYVTDAYAVFAWVAQTARILEGGEEIPPMILVGVDSPVSSRSEQQAGRSWSFTPTRVASQEQSQSEATGQTVRTGGADEFLTALSDEIIPWVETRYSVSEERGLFGDSLGGLFATHVLLTSPRLFTHYVIGSPALHWDDGVMFDREEAYASEHDDLPASVFISAGADEDPRGLMVSAMLRMSGNLLNRDYPSLVLERHIFDDETHYSVLGPTITRGLVFLFGNR